MDIRAVGADVYSAHPSTLPILVAMAVDDGPVTVHDISDGHEPQEWRKAVDYGYDIVGWNVLFEYLICTRQCRQWKMPQQSQWLDAQYIALANGFPAKLETCAKAMRLGEEKDSAGAALIKYWCRPNDGRFIEPSENAGLWESFRRYCEQDVRTMRAIVRALPALSPTMRQFWVAAFRANTIGIYVDLQLCKSLIDMASRAKIEIGEDCEAKTAFPAADIGDHRAVLAFVNARGVNATGVAKPMVVECLARDIDESARTVLEARQSLGKTSVAKLDKILAQAGPGSRIRGLLRSCGAATGRDTSVGVQLQNVPRGVKADVGALIASALEGDYDGFSELVASPLDGVVACLRGVFSASPGHVFAQCDFSAIEPRLGAWIVSDTKMLEAFRFIDKNGGVDIYQIEAAGFYNVQPADIAGEMRQFGKVYVLQNQYGAGEGSIQRSAKDMHGLKLTMDQAIECKRHWRAAHPLWVSMWYDLWNGALAAIGARGSVIRVGRLAWCCNEHLRLRLPSGRIVTFADPAIVYSDGRPVLEYAYAANSGRTWVRGTTTPGSLFNVAVQGTGACLMQAAVVRLAEHGMFPVLRAHDELVVEIKEGDDAARKLFMDTMLQTPPWADGLPINGNGWTGPRFKK